VLVVTAGVAGEGASTVSAQVGRHMAGLLGLRVLLVDLGGPRPGLVDQVARLSPPPVRVVPDGRRAWPELLGTAGAGWAVADLAAQGAPLRELDALVAAARPGFDLVLIDAPPWQAGPDTLLAIRACSHVMLVAAAESLTWEALDRIRADLEEEQVTMVGCVLNRYHRHLPRWAQRLLP
jgi:Mrp family chromosome partitioning ATPase